MNYEKLVEEIKRDEGLRLHAYQDHLGFWTIGYGRLIDARKGGGISEKEAEMLLSADLNRVLASINGRIPFFNELSDARKRAIVNMVFQMGIDGVLNFRRTLAALERKDYATAAEEAKFSRWYKQTPARAQRVIDLIEKG